MSLDLHPSRGGGEFLDVQWQTSGLQKTEGEDTRWVLRLIRDRMSVLWRQDGALCHANTISCHDTQLRIFLAGRDPQASSSPTLSECPIQGLKSCCF